MESIVFECQDAEDIVQACDEFHQNLTVRKTSEFKEYNSTSSMIEDVDSKSEHQMRAEHDFQRFQKWINPPPWAARLKAAQGKRAQGTCSWVFEDPKLQYLQSQACNDQSTLGDRTLSILGKSGYGKTILFASLVEYLGQCEPCHNSEAENLPPSLLYYFFEAKGGGNLASDGFRAMLAQLVSLHRHGETFIAAMNAMKTSKTNEETATDDEVKRLLKSLLCISGVSFLAFDGLDECLGPDGLFQGIDEILRDKESPRTCGLLLSGRPGVYLPSWLSKGSQTLNLDFQDNAADIGRYLLPKVEEMIVDGVLTTETSAQDIMQLICSHANGMFLWASKLLDYLRLPFLSNTERQNIILNLAPLEGLNELYDAIFDSSEAQIPGDLEVDYLKLFQLVAFARRYLSISELQEALSIKFDGSDSADDETLDLRSKLEVLSGSLIEATPNGTIQFVHLSVYGYVGSLRWRESREESKARHVSISKHADCDMASACISYLYHTIPAGPLSGSFRTPACVEVLSQSYPFLEYSARYWAVHLYLYINDLGEMPWLSDDLEAGCLFAAIALLINEWASHPKSIMAWIEATWLYGHSTWLPDFRAPRSSYISDLIFKKASSLEALDNVRELFEDIASLDRSWQHLLNKSPHEIWGPSIPSITKSRFLIDASKPPLTHLAPVQSFEGDFTICSQISDSGLEIGVVNLSNPSDLKEKSPSTLSTYDDWLLTYEVKSIVSGEVLCSIEHHLTSKATSLLRVNRIVRNLRSESHNEKEGVQDLNDHDDMKTQTTNPRDSWFVRNWYHSSASLLESLNSDLNDLGTDGCVQEEEVSIPVIISADLRKLAIVDTVIRLEFAPDQKRSESAQHTTIDKQALVINAESKSVPLRHDTPLDGGSFDSFCDLKFSPSSKHLVILQESSGKALKGKTSFGTLSQMTIFVDKRFGSSRGTDYVCVASIIFFTVPEIACLSASRGVSFHPTLPYLAFAQVVDGLPRTYIWDFEKPISRANPSAIYGPLIIDVHFTDNGEWLCGTNLPIEYGLHEEVGEDTCMPILVKMPDPLANWQPTTAFSSASALRELSLKAASKFAGRSKPHVQRMNRLLFTRRTSSVELLEPQKLPEQAQSAVPRRLKPR